MNHDLETVVELQQAQDELGEARRLLDGIPSWMEELHAEHSERKAVIDGHEGEAEAAASERRSAEAEIDDLKERVKHFQGQISLVTSQREYGALLQEIDTAKRQIDELEETALAALGTQEEIQEALVGEREAFQDLDQRYSKALAKWEEEKPEVAKRAEALEGRIEALEERVKPRTLALFNRIFKHYDGQAMAVVLEIDRGKGPKMWHCGACNYRVRPQAVVGIQTRNTIEACDSCKRILYIAAAAD